jgi:chemotaxis family two-component system sensor kinase Cph1
LPQAILAGASILPMREANMPQAPLRSDEATLTNCDREPIHIPGSIQPHGALLVLDPTTLTVVMAGGATERFLRAPSHEIIGQSLHARLGGLELKGLDGLTFEPTAMPKPTMVSEEGLTRATVDAMVSMSDGLLLLELEGRPKEIGLEGIELVQGMVRRLEAAPTFDKLAKAITQEVQAATGFDRVMLYRFQDDDSGHVAAETLRAPTVDSFLGLHFPATDIPVQARRLYVLNCIRHIPDARYQAAPLYPAINPRTGTPLDLSFCGLRSVSPVHLEYLANMGVVASTSLSLVIGGKLWGLVACHHAEPLYLSSRIRAACELFAQLASLQLQNRMEIELATGRLRTRDIQSGLISKASEIGPPESLLGPEPELLNLIPAAGVAVIADGLIDTAGQTPVPEAMPALLSALAELATGGVFVTDRFGGLTGIELGNGLAGVLALPISPEPGHYILWFLPEQIRDVTWAGDPSKPMITSLLGDRLTPRKSFESWTETVKGRSRPWSKVEIEAATLLRASLRELVMKRVDELARDRLGARAQQELLMAELDHRVKNSLATIQSMVRFSSRSAKDLVSFVTGIENRLQSMAKTHNLLTDTRWKGASLRVMVQDELRAHDIPGGCQIAVHGENFDLDPKAALAASMALHELVTNAIKHGCLADAGGKLDIAWAMEDRADGGFLTVDWTETCTRRIQAPVRRGFGRTLLEKVFGQDVGGAVRLDFEEFGLKCRMEIPASRVTARVAAVAIERTPAFSRNTDGLKGLRVLVVEDGALVAADLASWLSASGAIVVGPYNTLPEAFAAALGNFDVALLDVDINGEPVWALATALHERGVPFILTTGFSGKIVRPAEFANTVIVNKPYELSQLHAAISAVLAKAGTVQS